MGIEKETCSEKSLWQVKNNLWDGHDFQVVPVNLKKQEVRDFIFYFFQGKEEKVDKSVKKQRE